MIFQFLSPGATSLGHMPQQAQQRQTGIPQQLQVRYNQQSARRWVVGECQQCLIPATVAKGGVRA